MASKKKGAKGGGSTVKPGRRAAAKLVVKADGSYALTQDEQDKLARLLDEAKDTTAILSAQLLSFGRLVLREIFRGNVEAALDPARARNPLWLEFRRRSGGPTLRLTEKFISVSLRIAAWDKTITDENWRFLDPPRKEILLPLHDANRLREAAQHVTEFKLDNDATQQYVAALREAAGESVKTRLTPDRARSTTRQFVQRMRSGRAVQRLAEASAKMTPEERAVLEAEIDELEKYVKDVKAAIKRRK